MTSMFTARMELRAHRHDDDTGGAPHAHEHAAGEPTPSDPQAHRTPLSRGAGRGKLLHFDAFSGVAGDMCVAALVDLGVPFVVVTQAVQALGLPHVEVSIRSAAAGAIGATKFDVHETGQQPQRSYAAIKSLLDAAPLEPGARELAQRIFARLAWAEARVHRVAVDDVHFHEVGSVDSLVDIVAAAACLDFLDARLSCGPLPLGRGYVRCQHGLIPIPAPATLLCLERLHTIDAPIDAELVTPTGAAIVGELAEPSYWPAMRPLRSGWGRGTQTFPERPNALRVVLGEPSGAGGVLFPSAVGFASPTHVVVETNLDDSTGETLGHTLQVLLASGALDAWASPVVMKKGRPGWTVHALCPQPLAAAVADVLLGETSAIGVRTVPALRTELSRSVMEINTPYGPVPVKLSGDAGSRFEHAKPEFDVCQELARRSDVPLRWVVEAALVGHRERRFNK